MRWRFREAVNEEGQDRVMDGKRMTNKDMGFKYLCTYEEAEQAMWIEGGELKEKWGHEEIWKRIGAKRNDIHIWKCHNGTYYFVH